MKRECIMLVMACSVAAGIGFATPAAATEPDFESSVGAVRERVSEGSRSLGEKLARADEERREVDAVLLRLREEMSPKVREFSPDVLPAGHRDREYFGKMERRILCSRAAERFGCRDYDYDQSTQDCYGTGCWSGGNRREYLGRTGRRLECKDRARGGGCSDYDYNPGTQECWGTGCGGDLKRGGRAADHAPRLMAASYDPCRSRCELQFNICQNNCFGRSDQAVCMLICASEQRTCLWSCP